MCFFKKIIFFFILESSNDVIDPDVLQLLNEFTTPQSNAIDNTNSNPSNGLTADQQAEITLSKRQLKKQLRLQRWAETRKLKRIKEREKIRKKKLAAIERGEPRTGPSRKELKRKKVDDLNCKYTVAVDCSFNDLMTDLDLNKCVKQLLRVYTINRRSQYPIKLHFTSIVEGNRMYKVLEKNDGYQNWDVKFSPDSYVDVFDKSRIVYLSSDSENTIEHLEEDKIYIIGGLVDHNHHKGIALKKALEAGVQHAKLPLNENIVLKTRNVLSIYHGGLFYFF